jgi:tellurite resistance protein TerC
VLDNQVIVWGGFFALIITLLALDLGVFQRKAHEIHVKEALKWTVFWIGVGLSFTIVIWLEYPASPAAGELGRNEAVGYYLAGYITEKVLSVDNLFVFVILFSFFGVKSKDQHHVLFWGILGALVMRGLFIFIGIAAIEAYEPVLYIFGFLLIYTAIKMATSSDEEFDPSESRFYKFLKHFIPLSEKEHNGKFFIHENGKRVATCLFLCLLMVEMTDVLFAIDSVPAVFGVFEAGVTPDTFIVYTSNVFAILGLRALFFVIAGGIKSFTYLKPALIIVLAFIGVKMLIAGPWLHLYTVTGEISLAIVIIILGIGVGASVAKARSAKDGGPAHQLVENPHPERHFPAEGCSCGRLEGHDASCKEHPDNKE